MSVQNNVANINNWTSFTTTITATITNPTPGSGSTLTSYYLQVGKTLHIQMFFTNPNAGSNGSGIYLFNLPPGFTINTTICPLFSGNSSASQSSPIGTAWASESTLYGTGGTAIAYNSTNYAISIVNGASQGAFVSSSYYSGMAAGNTFSANCIIPIN